MELALDRKRKNNVLEEAIVLNALLLTYKEE
jgi:hypothetical protein